MPEPSNGALVVAVTKSGQYYSPKCSFKLFTVFLKEIWMTILLLAFMKSRNPLDLLSIFVNLVLCCLKLQVYLTDF